MIALQWDKFRCTFALAAACIIGAISQLHSVTWLPPEQLNLSGGSANGTGQIGSDANGNAIAMIEDFGITDPVVLVYNYAGGSWGSPLTLFTATVSNLTGQYSLSMIPAGQALAVWADTLNLGTTSNVYSAFYDGTSWSTPAPNPVATSLVATEFLNVTVSMNDSVNAVLVTQQVGGALSYSTFTSGVWSPLVQFDTISVAGNFVQPQLSYSNNGTAVAAWYDAGSVFASIFDGVATWTTTNLGSMNSSALESVGIDSNGNAIVIWADTLGDIVYRFWNGSSWSPVSNVSVAPASSELVAFSMAPGGTAVAGWLDSSGFGTYSTFNGSTWSTPAIFSTATDQFVDISISTDTAGNALIMYTTSGSTDIDAITLPLGGSLGAVELVTSDFSSANVASSLSPNGVQFALFNVDDSEGTEIFAAATLFVPPPSPTTLSIQGSVCKNKFVNQAELVKTIKWTPLQDPTVVRYTLQRNGTLIAHISSSGPFIYRDHKRCKKGGDVYTLTALNASGLIVDSATITL